MHNSLRTVRQPRHREGRRNDELFRPVQIETLKWHEVGIWNFFVEIQQKVNKKFGKVKIKA